MRCCRTSPIRRSLERACSPISWNCRHSSTSIGWNGRKFCGALLFTPRPANRCPPSCCAASWPRAPSTRVSRRWNISPRRLVDLEFFAASAENLTSGNSSKPHSAHRHAGGNRYAPPAAAFQHVFFRRRLCRGLLQLLWVEVLDADAFAALRGGGTFFDPATARKLARQYLRRRGLARAGSGLYRLRGTLPTPDALLARVGLSMPRLQGGLTLACAR